MENDQIRGRRPRRASRGQTGPRAFALKPPRLEPLGPEQEREAVELLAGLLADAAAKRCPGAFAGVSSSVMSGAFRGAPEAGSTGEGPVRVRDRGV